MNMLPYSGFPALPDKTEDMHAQLVALGLNDVEALTARIKKCEDWVDAVEETELTGNPVVFQNALAVPAKSLTATLNPIQDLHGYDHPWAGGAGKNLLPMTVSGIKALNTDGTWNGNTYTRFGATYTINTDSDGNIISFTAKGTPTSNFDLKIYYNFTTPSECIMNGCPANGGVNRYYLYVSGTSYSDTGSGVTVPANTTGLIYCRVFANFALPSNGIEFKPMIRLSTVTDSTFAPYSNICPISGRDSVVVDDVGKNQLPKYTNSSYTNSGITFTQDENGVITANGTATATVVFRQLFNFKGGRYILSGGVSNNNFVGIQRTDLLYVAQSFATESAAFDLPEGQYYKAVRIGNGETVNNIKFYPMIRDASISDSTYVPYALSSVTIQLGQTVYGGKIKSENGTTKLTVMYKSANLGDYTWEYKTAGYFDGTLSDVDNTIKCGTTANDLIGLLCSQYPEDTSNHLYNQAADNIIASRYTNGHIWVRDTSKGTNPTTFKTAMSGVQICYPLATPIELTLTPAQLQMLKGYNSVSSDDASSLTVTAYTGGPWESITRAIKKVTNKTKTTKKRRK